MAKKVFRYRVGKVTPQQELCLQTNKEFLVDEIEGDRVLERLCSQFIFSQDDKERIQGAGLRYSRRELNSRLVDTLMLRGPAGFEAFLQALEDTGHKAAFAKLREYLDSSDDGDGDSCTEDEAEVDQDDDFASQEAGEGLDEDLHQRVFDLASTVSDIRTRMDVLSLRVTQVDSSRQSEIDRLRLELYEARTEVARLRKENQDLSALVAERSEKLKCAETKIAELEDKITEMEAENEAIQRQFKQQTKRLENLQTRTKQSSQKILSLEGALDEQRSHHQQELDSHKRQHRRDMESLNGKLSREQEKRKAVEETLKKHKKDTEKAIAEMEEKFTEMLDQRLQDLANAGSKNDCPQNTARTSTRPNGRKVAFPDIYTRSKYKSKGKNLGHKF